MFASESNRRLPKQRPAELLKKNELRTGTSSTRVPHVAADGDGAGQLAPTSTHSIKSVTSTSKRVQQIWHRSTLIRTRREIALGGEPAVESEARVYQFGQVRIREHRTRKCLKYPLSGVFS